MFEWSDEDLMVRDAIRAFIDKEIRPHIDELETGQLPPYDITRKLLKTFGVDAMLADGLNKELAAEEAGTPRKSSGGGTGGLMSSMMMMVNIELAGVCLGLVGSLAVSMGLTSSTIRSRGTLAQKKRWLPGLVTMDTVGAWAITEPDSGSDALGGMKTTVRRDGAGGYVLNGQKTFITNGPYADTIVVFAKLD
ncbi:MAG: acyl-CoA dehydrogenase family protein, partial [Gordonia sp. (in: high G+C Gram-positive bacteria)]